MQFICHKQSVTLHGMLVGVVHVASKRQAAKLGNSVQGTCTLLIIILGPQGSITSKENLSVPADLQQLLDQYSKLFEVPTTLPPARTHDHRIHLVDESQHVKLRPYRYPSIQKDEIERMVEEMKVAGVIRDSTSSFASPVVLVKKKDGSWRLCIDYRQLNKLTVKDKFPIPLVEELLDELSGAFFFQTGLAIWLSPDPNG